MTNPLPALPDGVLQASEVDLAFELTDEHVELFDETLMTHLHDNPSTGVVTGESRRAALTEVVKLVWIEHVLPIEQALAASETQLAELGRKLHEAMTR